MVHGLIIRRVAFACLAVSILALLGQVSVEMSRYIETSKFAVGAADSGLSCFVYLIAFLNVLRRCSIAVSIFCVCGCVVVYLLWAERSKGQQTAASGDVFSSLGLWEVANVIGVVVFLGLASALWAPIGEEMTEAPGSGDGFYTLFVVRPIPVVFLGINVFTLVKALRCSVEGKRSLAVAKWLAVGLLWYAAFLLDLSRHYQL